MKPMKEVMAIFLSVASKTPMKRTKMSDQWNMVSPKILKGVRRLRRRQ